jgi:hypothetical protein
MTEAELVGDAPGAQPSFAQLKNASFDTTTDLRRRMDRPPTLRAQPGEVVGLVSLPPTTQDLARDMEVGAQRREGDALLM